MRTLYFLMFVLAFACNESKTVSGPRHPGRSNTANPVKEIAIQNEKAYWVEFLTMCDESKGKSFDQALEAKYGMKKPYQVRRRVQGDSVFISFDFISSCCEEYSGKVENRTDTVVLKAINKSLRACDCRCDYRLSFRMLRKDVESKAIRIEL